MKIYAVSNQKGGIGKTTTALAMAGILNRKGYKTLLIDTDPQCNSTDTYKARTYVVDPVSKGLDPNINEGVYTLYDVMFGEPQVDINMAIQETENGYIIASDSRLLNADKALASNYSREYVLVEALEKLEDFDYIIIDTAPAMNDMLANVLVAANNLIIPVTADRYALQGLSQLEENIFKIKKRQNPQLKIDGLLLVRYNKRANLSKAVKEAFDSEAERIGSKVFDTEIRESIKVKEAQAARQTLVSYAPDSTTATDYVKFVEELIGA